VQLWGEQPHHDFLPGFSPPTQKFRDLVGFMMDLIILIALIIPLFYLVRATRTSGKKSLAVPHLKSPQQFRIRQILDIGTVIDSQVAASSLV